jgi:hypothetical protein
MTHTHSYCRWSIVRWHSRLSRTSNIRNRILGPVSRTEDVFPAPYVYTVPSFQRLTRLNRQWRVTVILWDLRSTWWCLWKIHSLFYPEDGGSRLRRPVGNILRDCTASHWRGFNLSTIWPLTVQGQTDGLTERYSSLLKRTKEESGPFGHKKIGI